MTQSNRVQLAYVRETTPGTTPTTPRMRNARYTGESMFYRPLYNQSEEIRADRMSDDPTQIMFESGGGANMEFSYPKDDTWLSDVLRSLFYGLWSNAPQFDNDGTADSVITDAGTTANTYVVTSGGAAVKLGHLVRATGFTNSANNQIFRVASSTATTIVGTSLGLVAETAPPGTARLKVVGFAGASGDITATATGLGSTLLDFTTLGLVVGQWIKIGGTAAGDKFATAVLNDWMRITAITTTALTLDNRPAGWTTDTGTSKTIKVWFGDQIKNGTTQTALSIERGFLGQQTPTYIVNTGMTAGQGEIRLQNRAKVSISVTFTGMGGSQNTTTLDASPDAVTTNAVMSAHVNVGRLAEGGSAIASPNYGRSISIQINNNLRTIEDVSANAPVGINDGECSVTGTLETYFGSNTTLAKFFAGTVTSFNARIQKDSQAVVFQLPRVTLSGGGNPNAQAKNQDVMAAFEFTASKDSATSAQIIADRLEYYET